MRRAVVIGAGLGGTLIAWLFALFVAGFAARGCVEERTRARLAASLDAEVHIGATNVAVIRGFVSMRDLTIARDREGTLRVSVAEIHAGIAPLGAWLWDRALGTVEIRGVEIDVNGWNVLRVKPPKRTPMRFAALVIDDARMTVAPATWGPSWAKFRVVIEHAEAGPTVVRTPLSWVFALERLDARLELPGAAPVALRYASGRLEASGGVFGATPVSVPVTLPAPEPGREGQQLAALGKDVAERLALARASGWIRDKVGR